MRVIDLLNRIANGEELPKKIAIENDVLIYNDSEILCLQDWYYRCDEEDATWKIWAYNLNDEVEIIEDTPKISKLYINNKLQYDLAPKEDKKIEKINLKGYTSCLGTDEEWTTSEEIIIVKINEIIDKLNKEE